MYLDLEDNACVLGDVTNTTLSEYLAEMCRQSMPEEADEKFKGSFSVEIKVDGNVSAVKNFDFDRALNGLVITEFNALYGSVGVHVLEGGGKSLPGCLAHFICNTCREMIPKGAGKGRDGELCFEIKSPATQAVPETQPDGTVSETQPDDTIDLPF
jgi:hypothetical protein